jgi:hypothetical protein
MAELNPCTSQNAFIAINNMSVYAREDSALPPSKFQIPIAIKRRDIGVMTKTETGWHFAGPLNIDDAVYVQVPAKPVSRPALGTNPQ